MRACPPRSSTIFGVARRGAASPCPAPWHRRRREVETVSSSFPVPPFVSALLRGSCGRPAPVKLLLGLRPRSGSGSPVPVPPESRFWSWEPRALASGRPRQTGRTGEAYVLNRITLIGFLGGDAEKKVSNATNIATFSLATKTSWKNDAGTWESRTEWHRCVAFGRLAEFAGSLRALTSPSRASCAANTSGKSSSEIRRQLSRREFGKSESTPSSNSTAPTSGNRLPKATRRRPAKWHFLAR